MEEKDRLKEEDLKQLFDLLDRDDKMIILSFLIFLHLCSQWK